MSDETLNTLKRLETKMEKIWHLASLNKEKLWTIGDVASYLDISEAQVRTLMKTNQTFPRPRSYDVGKSMSNNRWVPKEVKDWFMRPEHVVGQAS